MPDGEERQGDEMNETGASATATGNIAEEDGIWGAHEGYTPLAAWAQAGGGNGLFSMGPTHDDDDSDSEENNVSGAGTFFANFQAFQVAAAAPSSDDDVDAEPENEEGYQALSTERDAEAAATFHSLADQALLALEDDYRMTLQGGKKSTLPSSPGHHGGDPNNATLQPSSSNDHDVNDDDGDVNVDSDLLPPTFAADFDAAQTDLYPAAADDEDDEKAVFETDFVGNLPQQPQSSPDIDTDRVRRVVETLRPGLEDKMARWERQQQRRETVPPLRHAYIPEDVCRTFRKLQAPHKTRTWSRAATLVHAWQRCRESVTSSRSISWVVHVLGCDHVEASSTEQLVATFGPLVTWMQEHARKPPQSIQLFLIGPNLAYESETELVKEKSTRRDCRLESIKVTCHTAYYHDWRTENASAAKPDLLLAFHPGFWGYDTWKPTLDWLVEKADDVPLVATSYTLLEAEEDQEVLKGLSAGTTLWEAEYNPFASQENRPTATGVKGEEYRENSAWQAWRI